MPITAHATGRILMIRLSALNLCNSIFMAVLLAVSTAPFSHGAEAGKGKAGKIFLIGADIVLVGTATALLVGQRKAASDYNSLYASTNQTTDESYQVLLTEKDKVDAKATTAGIVGVVPGTAVAYTLLDALVLRKKSQGRFR